MPALEFAAFRVNVNRARDMAAMAVSLSGLLTPALDTDDMLRAALAQGVSAFDLFIHEEVRVRMLTLAGGSGTPPPAYSRFQVTLASVSRAQSTPGVSWLDDEIRSQHGTQSFQHPDRVADAMRLVSSVELWNVVGGALGRSGPDVKRQLLLIADRRNRIVHEADMDPTPPARRFPISMALVSDSLDFLENVADAMTTVT